MNTERRNRGRPREEWGRPPVRLEPKNNPRPDDTDPSRGEYPMLPNRVSARRRLHIEALENRFCLSSLPVGTTVTVPDASTQARLSAAYGQLPMSFEANQGQTDAQVSFVSGGPGYTLFLTPDEAVLSLQSTAEPSSASGAVPQAAAGVVLRMQLIGANTTPGVVGLDPLPGASNYIIGGDSSQWHTDVPSFARVEENSVYPGVDLVYYGNQRQLEYDFNVAPGVDPGTIRLAFQGAESTTLDAQGNLVLQTPGGDVVEHAPVLYQEAGGARQYVSGHYVLEGNGQVGFTVGVYDRREPLVIDPTLSYSTYLGGTANDYGLGIAVDSAGNAYITGATSSSSFPTASPIQPTYGGGSLGQGDAFVTKLNAAGTALVYSTYLGGSGDDYATGIAVDGAGNAYVTGSTKSPNFPTENPLQPAYNGGGDAFVAKLNAAGSALVYSTYLGGSGEDHANGIAVDSAGYAFVTGSTESLNFPTENPVQSMLEGATDTTPAAFVTKLNPAGSGLVYSTYLGGSGYTVGNGIAVDSTGYAYVTGTTSSATFPTTPGVFQAAQKGTNYDAFVTKLSATGSALIYSTYLGGGGSDGGEGIAVDSTGNVYVAGATSSSDFPTVNPIQAANGGSTVIGQLYSVDGFVTKLNSGGTALIYSTYLGGSGEDYATGVAVNSAGEAYVTGITDSSGFPTANALQTYLDGVAGTPYSDAFVTKLNAPGTALVYSTYLGGSRAEQGNGIAVDPAGNAYITGMTGSSDFPTTNPLQPNNNAEEGYGTIFVSKIASGQSLVVSATTLTVPSNRSIVGQQVTFTASVIVPQGTGVPTGTVTFLEGTLVLGTGTLNGAGRAIFTTSSLAAGNDSIIAVYAGDLSFAASSSSPVVVTVKAAALIPTTTTLAGSSTFADFGQMVTLTAIVRAQDLSTWLKDSVVFTIDGIASTTVSLQWVEGQDLATLTTSTFAAGTHTIAASFAGDATFATSVSNTLKVTISEPTTSPGGVPPDGPLVVSFQRFGYHSQPTVLVLMFSENLDPMTANNAANYRIVPVGPRGKFGPAMDIKRITYNPAAWTVTVYPSHRLNIHKRFELIVDGASKHAVADQTLHALDGGKTGKPGSNFVGVVDWATLAGPSLTGEKYTNAWKKMLRDHDVN